MLFGSVQKSVDSIGKVSSRCLHCLPAAILQDQGIEVPQHGGSILDFIFYCFTMPTLYTV